VTVDTRDVYNTRFLLAYLVLGLVTVGSGLGLWAQTSAAQTAHCSGSPSIDPITTAVVFLHNAVERHDTARSWGLVTTSLRGARTCSQWAHGSLPVEPYRDIDWNRASYRIEARGDRQIVLAVKLYSRSRHEEARRFLLELREVGDVWLVGTWTRATV
jgi:hypothetical protein